MLRGCAQSVLDPGINQAAVRLLNRKGVEVVFAAGDGCCGALVHHMGRREQAHAQAKAMIDAWIALMDGEGGLDAILVTTSGCGTTVKDYGFMFRDEPDWAEKARRVSAIARDVTEYLETLDLGTPATPGTLTVAYHSACSLQHGQQIKTAPKTLLARAGFTVREPAEGHLCCGSAGTYNMLQPELSAQLRARKVANIEATGADVVAAGNLGCMTQIGMASRLPIVHTVELLDWAHGGPRPAALDGMAPVTEM
jgi:glycolate oxidase iron-sulfur subunit